MSTGLPTLDDVRRVVLEVVHELANNRRALSTSAVTELARERLGPRNASVELAILTCWYELFRTGVLSWGLDFANRDPPWAHLTEHGQRTLRNVGRDPANPDGYLAAVGGAVVPGSVAHSYVVEALATYNAGCFKAAAVMVGAAAESLALELRDEVTARLTSLGHQVPQKLSDRSIKRVLDALEAECDSRKATMAQSLRERFESFWASFTSMLRLPRNDAGHPKSVDPVTLDVVHGSLLVFPELAKLVVDLRDWVQSQAFQ